MRPYYYVYRPPARAARHTTRREVEPLLYRDGSQRRRRQLRRAWPVGASPAPPAAVVAAARGRWPVAGALAGSNLESRLAEGFGFGGFGRGRAHTHTLRACPAPPHARTARPLHADTEKRVPHRPSWPAARVRSHGHGGLAAAAAQPPREANPLWPCGTPGRDGAEAAAWFGKVIPHTHTFRAVWGGYLSPNLIACNGAITLPLFH